MAYFARRQAGSVIAFVLVGIVLLAAAVGAIVVVQNRTAQDITTRPQPREEVAVQDEDEATSEEEAAREAEQKEAEEREAEERRAAEEAAEQEREAQRAADAAAPSSEAPVTTPANRADALPSTGPEQTTLDSIIGLIALIGAGYGYYHFGQRR